MKNLPGWATYLIAGLGAVVMLMMGISGTIITRDRDSIEKAMCGIKDAVKSHHDEIQKVVETQNNQIVMLMQYNDRQNHVMDKICLFLSVPYEKRKEMMRDYPLMIKPRTETR